MSDREILKRAAEEAIAYYAALDEKPVAATAGYEELHRRLAKELPETGVEPATVIGELIRDVDGGLLASGGPRFFGWVVGGALPVALAADWLTSAWDQNAAIYACSPAEAVIEEVAGSWLKEVLGIPLTASFGLTTGCQMAHVTALAAARHRLLSERGWDVETRGLFGAPPIRVLTGEHRHESLLRALRFLGLGTESVRTVSRSEDGVLNVDSLRVELDACEDAPVVVVLQAGDLNAGTFDPFSRACDVARERGAWVHVDGAFGLWAQASPSHRHLLEGAERADSWATDGHKWLNLPFDNGFVFVADREAHRAAMATTASYFIAPEGSGRDSMEWNPEWSRRGRGVAVYAALRALGKSGVRDLVERCCRLAKRLVEEIGSLPGAEIIAHPIINQGLVQFLGSDGDHDRRTEEVMAAVRASGIAWFGGTTFRGARAMRVSVCNFRTTDEDVDRTVQVFRDFLRASAF
jgi:glutamate/tyrosine decarboxylase-like PLP-dependent enzyme